MYNIVSSQKSKIGRFSIVYDIIEKGGVRQPYSYVIMREAVGILAFCGDNIVLIKQYRYMFDSWEYEIPGGMVDEGASPEEAALRELREETGYEAEKLVPLGFCYPSLGATTEKMHLFCTECGNNRSQELDCLETISVESVSFASFRKMVADGTFNQSTGMVALARYREMFEK